MTDQPPPFLPYGRQCIDEADIAAVVEALKAPMLTGGPTVDAFEAALATAVTAPHAVACANGTAALHLACLALDIGPGKSVAVPSITFSATANAALYCGADVLFVDVDPDSGLMTVEALDRAVAAWQGPPVAAVFPVHLAGQAADMAAIGGYARDRGWAVVEDACHALGTDADWGPVGGCAHSDMTVFSFHPVKTVAMGEGGALTTRDAAIAHRLRRLRSHGITREAAEFSETDLAYAADGTVNPWYYELTELGYNYRASDIQCALGLSQLGKLEAFAARRNHLAARYDAALAPLAPLVRGLGRRPNPRPAWHLYVALFDFPAIGIDRASLMRTLHQRGIGTQVHYIPVPSMPVYRRRYGRQSFPGAEAYYARALSLPLFPAMQDEDVTRVCAVLGEVIGA